MEKSLANEKLPEETKPKLETNIKEKDEAVKARDNNLVDSDYTDRSICGLILINHNDVDYIQVTYRSLRGLVGDKLVKAENDNEKRMLKSCREDFPNAKMLAFYCRGNWFLRIRGFVAKIVSSRPKKITGSRTGKNNMLYRLPPAMTKEDMLRALNNALIEADVISSGSCCKDYLRLKEIDLKSQVVLKDELDDINENEELDDTEECEEMDDTDDSEDLGDTDEDEDLGDTDQNEEVDDKDKNKKREYTNTERARPREEE